MTKNGKDTIYIDVDDEITSIVDKLTHSDSKIVALVLPKRAVALQSIVNMKLLKRAADEAGKNVVLITSENSLLPLAGATGIHVAKNLQSKPEIPEPPAGPKDANEEIEADVDPEEDKVIDKSTAVGALAGAAIAKDTIDMSEEDAAAEAAASAKPKNKAAKSGAKKPKIPNFELFRKKLFLVIGGVIALIVFWILAVFVLPKATIAIETDTQAVEANFEFTASPSSDSVSTDKMVIPAKKAETDKEDSQTHAATGEKDLGTKASGTVTMSIPCSDVSGSPPTIPRGTGVSANGLTYLTQSSTSLTTPNFSGGCTFTGSTKVVAQNNGDQYNIGATSYTVSGYSKVSGSGTAMTGGSSKIAKVVAQSDVDAAKDKLNDDDDNIKKDLKQELESQGLYAIESTFKTTKAALAVNPGVGEEANEVKVSFKATYSMLGVKREELKQLIEVSLKDQIDTDRQQIQEDGLDEAQFTVKSSKSNGDTVIAVETTAQVGPDINVEQLKSDIAGQKKGDTENIVKALPGVKDVNVDYSPFWVGKTPKKTEKITITFHASTDSNN